MKFNTIILAAGMGKRLKTNTCKVIVQLINKPLIIHLLDNLKGLLSDKNTFIVIGHQGEEVKEVVTSKYPAAQFAWQKEQLG
ncbi:MAG: NTP transferase domain-containing protein, partial [Candidatus Omnitrophota bacterium]